MNNMTRLIRRSLGILLLSTILLLALNLLLLVGISAKVTANGAPWTMAKETAAALEKTEGGYVLSPQMTQALEQEDAWAIFIQNDTMEVAWHTENLPDCIPRGYTISDISRLTQGYLEDYPTYTGAADQGLVVVGYPKDRFWKHMFPSWDFAFIQKVPTLALTVIGANLLLICGIFFTANAQLLRSLRPIARGIQTLPSGEPVVVKPQGLLSDLALKINQTAQILQQQQLSLAKKERARANWISGVSHDIRTPLSMVMGYAEQMAEDPALPAKSREKSRIICQQSLRIRDLINDLNLASKLEYNMQPLSPAPVNLVAVARQSVADHLNLDMEGKYPITWEGPSCQEALIIQGDRALLRRAVGNLITNAQVHNPAGCAITVSVGRIGEEFRIRVADNGVGISQENLEKLRCTPHYMMSDNGTTEPRHGLGLLIVGQIAHAHGGTLQFGQGETGGFTAEIHFPAPEK